MHLANTVCDAVTEAGNHFMVNLNITTSTQVQAAIVSSAATSH
jgi:hypothetical protein